MQGIDVQDYARQMYEAHGAKAIAEAAQKAHNLEKQGKNEEAETWRLIQSTIKEMRAPGEGR